MKKFLLFMFVAFSIISYAQTDKSKTKISTNKEKLKSNSLCTLTYNYIRRKSHQEIKIPINNGVIEYTKVVNIDSIPKDIIYSALKISFAELYEKVVDFVLNLDDKDNGVLITKKNKSPFVFDKKKRGYRVSGYISFSLRIECKDNKYKVRLYDVDGVGGSLWSQYECLTKGAYDDGTIIRSSFLGRSIIGFGLAPLNYLYVLEKHVHKNIKSLLSDNW